jgi:hypothetical protein
MDHIKEPSPELDGLASRDHAAIGSTGSRARLSGGIYEEALTAELQLAGFRGSGRSSLA